MSLLYLPPLLFRETDYFSASLNVLLFRPRKLYPGVCSGIFYDEASSEKFTDDNGDLNAMGQLYYEYNEAARLAVGGLSKHVQQELG